MCGSWDCEVQERLDTCSIQFIAENAIQNFQTETVSRHDKRSDDHSLLDNFYRGKLQKLSLLVTKPELIISLNPDEIKYIRCISSLPRLGCFLVLPTTTSKYLQTTSDAEKYLQTTSDTEKYLQTASDAEKYLQTASDAEKYL